MNCSKCNAAPRLNKDSYCRECRNKYNRDWARAHPAAVTAYRERLDRLRAAGEYEPRAWEAGKAGRPPGSTP